MMKEDNYEQPYRDLMGDIIKKHTEEGGMDNLPGAGKPLSQDYLSGDTFQHFQRIAKDAGYKPHWLKLQQEINEEVKNLSKLHVANPTLEVEKELKGINDKLATYNQLCPPPMQKSQVSLATLKAIAAQK